MKKKLDIAVLLTISTMVLAVGPAGWKVVAERKKKCQYAVPADWTQETILIGTATSADKKATS